MLGAIFKLVAITAGVLILAIVVGVGARVTGLRQQTQVPPHPWFERSTWQIAAPAPDELCTHPPAARPDWILALPVRKTPADWVVACGTAPTLADFLARSPHQDWLIDVEAGVPDDLDKFVDIVNNHGPRRIGIHAASQRAARHLRKKAPHWVFAADDASLLRLHMFTGLFLEPAVEFWPDFVLTGAGDADALGPREVTELHRRRKRVIWVGEGEAPFEVDGRVRRSP